MTQRDKTRPPAPAAQTACGAQSLQACASGLCLTCAPRGLVDRIRAGVQALPAIWRGAAP